MRYASHISPQWGHWAQYCRANAGFYRNFPRKLRRDLEIAAHQAGVQQIPKGLLRRPFSDIDKLLVEAAK